MFKTSKKKDGSLKICIVILFIIAQFCFIDGRTNSKNRTRLRKKDVSVELIPQRQTKLPHELTYQELEEKKNQYLAFGNREGAVKIVEQMLRLCVDMNTLPELILELAGILYDDSKFDPALTAYKNFMEHYAGHQKFEYALFRAIQCSSRLVLHFDRDQTKTEETITLAEKYLSEADCVLYRTEVERIKNECLAHLFASELYTIEFYAKTGKIAIAAKRLQEIQEHVLFQNLQNYQQEIERIRMTYSLPNSQLIAKSVDAQENELAEAKSVLIGDLEYI